MVIFWRVGLPDSLGMLFQAPIYAYFIWIALMHYPLMARWLVIWLVGVVVITWPRFPQIVIPKFISGLQEITARGRNSDVK